jgi:hypothetical protein
MTAVNTLEDVKRDYRYVWEFKVQHYGLYKRCKDSCLALSRTMGVDFKAVYRYAPLLEGDRPNRWTDTDVNWCGETFYAVNPKGKVIVFSNSEWGGVEHVKK